MTHLFDDCDKPTDHRAFRNIRGSTLNPELKDWCERRYLQLQALLDQDFPQRFRRETPQRLSELFFAASFVDAGWAPAPKVSGFDLTFAMEGGGRLLVEVTTPNADATKDTWQSETRGNLTQWSADGASQDAALRRITSGFFNKARDVSRFRAEGRIGASDYVVIAISGLCLVQETPMSIEIGGDVPDYVRAFLPIGDRFVTFILNDGGVRMDPDVGGCKFSETIEQAGQQSVNRDAFFSGQFAHIDAVAYSPMRLLNPDPPQSQVGVLHNPTSSRPGPPTRLRMIDERVVEITDTEFSVALLV